MYYIADLFWLVWHVYFVNNYYLIYYEHPSPRPATLFQHDNHVLLGLCKNIVKAQTRLFMSSANPSYLTVFVASMPASKLLLWKAETLDDGEEVVRKFHFKDGPLDV